MCPNPPFVYYLLDHGVCLYFDSSSDYFATPAWCPRPPILLQKVGLWDGQEHPIDLLLPERQWVFLLSLVGEVGGWNL